MEADSLAQERFSIHGQSLLSRIFFLKYLGRSGGNDGVVADADLGWDNNQSIYRYSETLLNAAELILRTGGDAAKAQGFYNEVRNCAYASARTVSLDNLLEERRMEFVGEGKRYYDLIRFGKAAEVLKPGRGKVLNKAKTAYDVLGVPETSKSVLKLNSVAGGGFAISILAQ